MRSNHLLALALAAPLLVRAQGTTVLEGFETGTDAIAVFSDYGGRSAQGKVTLSRYTARGQGDARVSEGTHSVAVTIGEAGFGNDLKITLSETASAAIQAAAAASAEGANAARYILRYDLILTGTGVFSYFNHNALIGNSWDFAVGAAARSGRVSVSVALDVNALGLPTSGAISWVLANSFGMASGASLPITFYIDNIRLVDTYGPGVVNPVVYPLQSFEDDGAPLGGAVNFTGWDGANPVVRTMLSRYTAAFAGDLAVSDGAHSLQVDNSAPGSFHADFTLPLTGTRLAEILRLDRPVVERPSAAQLAHYTLRWDVLFPDAANGVYVNQLYHTGSAYFPMAQGRQQWGGPTADQRLTYSVTLDQITAWGGLTADPGLIFINDGPPAAASVYYYDNFRLLDTAPEPPALRVTAYDPATRVATLVWSSIPGAVYTVESALALDPGGFGPVRTDLPSGGAETSATITLPAGSAHFLRIRVQ